MVRRSVAPRTRSVCLAAALPGALYVAAIGARSLEAGRPVQASVFVLAALLAAVFSWSIIRARHIPTWTFTGIGLALPILFTGAWDIWFVAPARSLELRAGHTLASGLLPAVGLAGYAALLWIGQRRSRADGPAGVLLLIGSVTVLAFAIMDPTYGLYLRVDGRLVGAGLEAPALVPTLILLPPWVLRARSWRSQAWVLLALSALSLEIMALTPLVTAVARLEEGVLNAPPLSEAVPYIVLVRTAFAALFWGLLALVVLLTLRARERHPPRHSPPQLASDASATT